MRIKKIPFAAAAALILLTSGKPVMKTTLVRTSTADPCLACESELRAMVSGITSIRLLSLKVFCKENIKA